MAFEPSVWIYCKKSAHRGRGVFARRLIPAGTIIEEVPVIVLPVTDLWKAAGLDVLQHYVFHWRDGRVAIALGYGSLYNHSYQPNARCEDLGPQKKRFIALREIQADEEITFNYAGAPDAREDVGFTVYEPAGP